MVSSMSGFTDIICHRENETTIWKNSFELFCCVSQCRSRVFICSAEELLIRIKIDIAKRSQ